MHLTSKAGQKETPTITPTVPDGLLRCRSRLTEQTGRLRRIPGSGRQEKQGSQTTIKNWFRQSTALLGALNHAFRRNDGLRP